MGVSRSSARRDSASEPTGAEIAPMTEPVAASSRRQTTLSLLHAVAELDAASYSPKEIAVALNLTAARVKALLRDDRMAVAAGLFGGVLGPLESARARYRVERAREAIDDALHSPDRWLRFQAALSVLAEEERRREKTEKVEVILSPAFLQDVPIEGAIPDDMEDEASFEGQSDADDVKSMQP